MGRTTWRSLLRTYLRPRWRLVATLGVMLMLATALKIVTPQLIRVFVDRATSKSTIGAIAWVYIGAALLQQVFRVLTAWLSETVGWLTTNELRGDLMAHCLELDSTFHRDHPPGELIERIDGDVTGLTVVFSEFLVTVVGNVLMLLGVLVIVWMQNATAGLTLSVFAAISVALLVVLRRVAAPAWSRAREASGQLFGFLEERLAGTEDLRSAGAEPFTLNGFYARARERLWSTSRARQMDTIPSIANALIRACANALGFVVPAVLVQRGSISLGMAFALYFYTQLLIQPLDTMSHQVQALQQAIAGGRRVIELLGVRRKVVDGLSGSLPNGALAVGFDSVGFGYGDDPDVLHDVTIEVPAGSTLGIVGRTGSGKSTLARLLVRLHDPRTGIVTLDGCDVRELSRRLLRTRVTVVSQDVHVFRATVRDNLTLFDRGVDDAAILDALARLGLNSWFEALPSGLDTVLRDGGAGMSAGESQLLALGRAFLADPSVVVLDEASSRLDPASETMLEGAIDRLLAGRTAIIIAHRLATLERCDDVCVLDRGRVVEHGPRDRLAADPTSRFGALLRAVPSRTGAS